MQKIRAFLTELGQFGVFFIETFRKAPSNIAKPYEIFKNIYTIGVNSVPVVLLTGFFIGMIMGLQLGNALESTFAGASQYISGGLSVGLLTEIGPVFTSLIVVSRVCSSVTAQLGTMKVTEQIDALKTFAVNPVGYLVTPRVLAGMISLPILGLISILASMFGVYLMIAGLQEIPTGIFLEIAQMTVNPRNVIESVEKMVVIGGFLLLISTYYGFEAKGGAAGVGEATIKSVVVSSFMVILLDYVMGTIFIIISGGAA